MDDNWAVRDGLVVDECGKYSDWKTFARNVMPKEINKADSSFC